MHRIDRLNGSGGARLAAALLLCVLFFLLTVSLVRVGFESNDDLTLAAFVDGQMAALKMLIEDKTHLQREEFAKVLSPIAPPSYKEIEKDFSLYRANTTPEV